MRETGEGSVLGRDVARGVAVMANLVSRCQLFRRLNKKRGDDMNNNGALLNLSKTKSFS
jgi:hypothetical protein